MLLIGWPAYELDGDARGREHDAGVDVRAQAVDHSLPRIWPMAASVSGVQIGDLWAKAATGKAEAAGDVRQAQRQPGHSSVVMTEHCIRNRNGAKITPTR